MGASYPKPQLKEGVEPCGGKTMIYLPDMIKNMIYFSVGECERIKGSPGNIPEIAVVFHKNYTRWISQGYISAFL